MVNRFGRRMRTLRFWLATSASLLIAAALLTLGGVVGVQSASAVASAPIVMQCNPPAFPTGAGQQATCSVTVENTVTNQGATSSVVTATECEAAAGVLPPNGCTTTVTTSSTLVTSVNQCNGIFASGSNVDCSVTVVNNVPIGTAETDVTVDECVGSGAGGGATPLVCDPMTATTDATVTQCNGSANGGGGTMRVICSAGGEQALAVTINQCNSSANGGGDTVHCTSTSSDVFEAATPPVVPPPVIPPPVIPPPVIPPPVIPPPVIPPPVIPPPVVVPPVIPPPVVVPPVVAPPVVAPVVAPTVVPVVAPVVAPAVAPAAVGTSPTTGSAASSPRAGTAAVTSATPSVVSPTGSPQTGVGGAAHSGVNPLLVGAGGLALLGAFAAASQAMRRRRMLDASAGLDTE
jgi:hypothetical protein